MSNHSDLRALLATRSGAAAELRALASDPATDPARLQASGDRLAVLDRLVAEASQSSRRATVLVSAVVLGLLLTLLTTVEVYEADFDMDVNASAVKFVLRENCVLETVSLQGPLVVEGRYDVQPAVEGLRNEAVNPLRIDGPQLVIQSLKLPAGSVLEFAKDASQFDVNVTGISGSRSPIDLLLVLSGKTSTVEVVVPPATTPTTYRFTETQTLRFVSPAAPPGAEQRDVGSSAHVRLGAKGLAAPFKSSACDMTSIEYTEYVAAEPDQTHRASSVQSGWINVDSARAKRDVEVGQTLKVSEMSAGRTELSIGGAAAANIVQPDIRVRASGRAKSLLLDQAGRETSLKPSLLEFLRRNYLVGLLWTAAVFLWTLSRSWHKEIFR